jgi:putative phosphoesterase
MKKICLISDSHGHLPDRALKYIEGSDELWHAGDIGVPDILRNIPCEKIRAVRGNIDTATTHSRYPEELQWEEGGLKFFMIHIGGKPGKYAKGIKQRIRELKPDVFICGHSHILKIQYDEALKVLYMNPGAIGKEGFHKVKTLLTFEIHDKNLRNLNVVELEPR